MKTNLFMALAFAFLMLFAACTKEKIIYVEKDSDIELLPGEGVLKISLSNSVETKAARPIGNSEAANNVNRIAFKIISNVSSNPDRTEGVSIQLVDSKGEPSGDSRYSVQDNVICLSTKFFSTDETLYVKFSNLPKGVFGKIIAYGYNCEGEEITFPYDSINVPSSYLPPLECQGLSNDMINKNCIIEEIFAGSADININDFGKFKTQPKIVLKRQVAGLMAYLEKVPAFVDTTKVAKITIRTYAPIIGFKFPSDMLGDKSYNGIVTSSYAEGVDLLTFNLQELATNYDRVSMGSTYTFDGGNNFATEMNGINIEDLVLEKNTLFGSRFLLPYAGNWDAITFSICFFGETGEDPLEEVNLRNGGDSSSSEDSEYYRYNIKCNHFYSIGTKGNVDDTDADNPLDITLASGYDIAEVTITDQWDDVYGLVTPWTPASSSD